MRSGIIGALIVIASSSGCLLNAAPTVGVTTIKPAFIPIDALASVQFSATFNGGVPIAVNLIRLDAGGKAIAPPVGTLTDPKTTGTFSLTTNLKEVAAGPISFKISASFRGLPLNVFSNAFTLTVVSADRIDTTLPSTPNPITGDMPPVTAAQSTNVTSAFATLGAADLLTVFKSSGTLTSTAINVQPTTATPALQWQIDEDPTDDLVGGAIVVMGSPGTQVTFAPAGAGNYRLALYLDVNGNGKFDAGEQLRVMRFAVLQATLQPGSFFTLTKANITANATRAFVTSGTAAKPCMNLQADYLFEGGGATRTIGTDSLTVGTAVTQNEGVLANVLADTFVAAYPVPKLPVIGPADMAGTGTELPCLKAGCGDITKPANTNPVPMIDTSRVALSVAASGRGTPFRSTSMTTDITAVGAKGRTLRVTAIDAPNFVWANTHPTTTNPWGSTSGGNQFIEFVTVWPNAFSANYFVLSSAGWTFTATGTNKTGNGIWVDSGTSNVSGDATLTSVMKTGQAAGLQPLGLSFVRQVDFRYEP